ncbi:MAG TPA: hypothetical protein VJ201_07455 [Candidatus Babeliales bacterium]|nr:hypothetical protein [Candidatus Babeliales bacterium]
MPTIKDFFLLIIVFLNIMYTPYALSLHILHLSFHRGCISEINLIAQQLGAEVTSIFIPNLAPKEFDGKSAGNVLYNIGHERALNVWNKHKDYFNQFDAVITSDTAPLSRIFLQNNYTKPLIIWICNRFDYADNSSLDCTFPDEEYYELLRQAKHKKNVYTIPYNAFESFYAAQKNVTFNNEVIQPSGIFITQNKQSAIPRHIDKSKTFFIPPYLNDLSMNLTQKCSQLGIEAYNGRYNGPSDLEGFKGIIHIPYNWSNLAFFENMQSSLPYFIPSITFMITHFDKNTIWWANGNYFKKNYHFAEWYNKENSEIITYFDSWDDLKYKIESTDFDALQTKIKQYAQTHKNNVLHKWRAIFDMIAHNKECTADV